MKDRIRLAAMAVVSCGLCGTSALSRAAQPLTGLLACRAIADAAARLACFDRESAVIDSRAVAVTPAPAAAAAAAVPPPDPLKQFGLPERTVADQEIAAGVRAADPTKIEAHVLHLSTATNGHVTFSLDNGQIWRQLTAEGELLIKPGDVIVISRASLGSYWLQPDTGRGFKVSRVR
jgi:hypothetical protein